MKIKNIESGHKIVGDFVIVPLYDIITPKHNRIVMAERWWALTSNDEVLFYKYYGRFYSSPQCNSNFKIVNAETGKTVKYRKTNDAIRFKTTVGSTYLIDFQ